MTGTLGVRTLPQTSVTVGRVTGAVAADSQLTVELFVMAGIVMPPLDAIV